MSNLREALAATALANLGWSEGERAIDRVAASGKCPRLGVDLWKARYMLEAQAYADAREGFRALYKERYIREHQNVTDRLVDQCLHEFLSPFCSTCGGAKEMMVGELKVTCSTCDGVGVKNYTDEERAGCMGLSYGLTKRLSHKFRWVLGVMQALDTEVNRLLNIELGREAAG